MTTTTCANSAGMASSDGKGGLTLGDAVNRLGRWLEEGESLRQALVSLLEECQRLRVAAAAADEESERLRNEARALRTPSRSRTAPCRNEREQVASRVASAPRRALTSR
jgi:hypothetical protein